MSRWQKAGNEVLNNLQTYTQPDSVFQKACLKEIELEDGIEVPRTDFPRQRSSNELNQKNLVHSYNNILCQRLFDRAVTVG